MDKTTITMKKTTRKRLSDICRKNQSYDTLLNEMIDFWVKNRK